MAIVVALWGTSVPDNTGRVVMMMIAVFLAAWGGPKKKNIDQDKG
jgi:hypothetical protein